jgi:hypothetical protein
MTTSAYPALTDAENAFKQIVWTPLIKMGEVALDGVQATIPVIDSSIFEGLEDDAINAITDALFNQIVLFIDVTVIKLKNAELQTKWTTASEALTLIAQEQGVTSSAYQTALSTAASDFASWVHTGP